MSKTEYSLVLTSPSRFFFFLIRDGTDRPAESPLYAGALSLKFRFWYSPVPNQCPCGSNKTSERRLENK